MRGRGLGRRELGSASVLVVGAVGAIVLVLSGVLVVAGAVRDIHRVQTAADLGALAAVGGASSGGGPDCRAATAVVEANGARLTRCDIEPDGSVVVRAAVHRRWPRGWRLPRTISARARAGVVEVADTVGTPVYRSAGRTTVRPGGRRAACGCRRGAATCRSPSRKCAGCRRRPRHPPSPTAACR